MVIMENWISVVLSQGMGIVKNWASKEAVLQCVVDAQLTFGVL